MSASRDHIRPSEWLSHPHSWSRHCGMRGPERQREPRPLQTGVGQPAPATDSQNDQ